jgi:hypothetical protein
MLYSKYRYGLKNSKKMEIVKRSPFKNSLVDDVFAIDWENWRLSNQFHLELNGVPVENEGQIDDNAERQLYKRLLPIVRRMNSHVAMIANNGILLQYKFSQGSGNRVLLKDKTPGSVNSTDQG